MFSPIIDLGKNRDEGDLELNPGLLLIKDYQLKRPFPIHLTWIGWQLIQTVHPLKASRLECR